jgi:phosphoglycerate dehydrogenase-like enzyme
MKPGASLVNASRGRLSKRRRWRERLNERRIRAALDVTDPEPLPEGHPLWKAPNLLITPHVAGDADRFMRRAFLLIRETIDPRAGGKVYAGRDTLINAVKGEY